MGISLKLDIHVHVEQPVDSKKTKKQKLFQYH